MIAALGAPLLYTSLPRADLFRELPVRGRLDRLVAELDERENGLTAALATRDAWYRTLDLTTEVECLLRGLALAPWNGEPELMRDRRIVARAAETAA